MLYLIATPIGNLGDFTFRAVETIKTCDYLLCEDTRRSRILLNHYALSVPLKSFHQFNEASREDSIIEDLENGKTVGLLTDAGTPLISDPGERLVRRCRIAGIPVSSLPGACSPIVALSASGLGAERFQFLGFLPKKKGRLEKLLDEILQYDGTSICFESPYRIAKTLQALAKKNPACRCVVARELTKKFETFLSGEAGALASTISSTPLKGEIVLMISPKD